MVKKRNRRFIIIGAVIAVVIIAIFLLTPDVVETKSVAQVIQDHIDAGLFEIPFACSSVTECEEQGIEISDPIEQSPIDEITVPIPNEPEEITPIPVCTEDEVLVDGFCEPVPEEEPEPPTVELVATTTKTDNSGESFVTTTRTEFTLLSFFVEDTSNRSFDQGLIEQRLIVETQPNLEIQGSGVFDVLIKGESILAEKIDISVNGVTDESGQLTVSFISPTGLSSDLFLFQFKDNISRFDLQGTNTLTFKINEMNLIIGENNYSLENEDIFEFDVSRDQNRIIIEDEEGNLIRVFPTDDTIKLCSNVGKTTSRYCISNSFRFGCQQFRVVTSLNPSPQVGSWEFSHFDRNLGEFVQVKSGSAFGGSNASVCPLDQLIQRDEIYKIEIDNPNGVTIAWKTPEEKKDFNFICKGVVSNKISGTTSPETCNYLTQGFLDKLELIE